MKKNINVPAHYNYVAYSHAKKGLFRGATGEIEEERIIGEIDDAYVYRLLKSTSWNTGEPYLSPIAIHKTRLIKWLPTQMEMF